MRSSNSESEEEIDKMNLTPQREDYSTKILPKEFEKILKKSKKFKSTKKDIVAIRRTEEPRNEAEEEHQLKLAIELSKAKAKKNGVHNMEILP